MSNIPLVDEILGNSRFKDLQKKEPMQALALYSSIKEGLNNEWDAFVKVRDWEREKFRLNMATDGRIVAHLPKAIMPWIEFLKQDDPSAKTVIKRFLMSHPEFTIRPIKV